MTKAAPSAKSWGATLAMRRRDAGLSAAAVARRLGQLGITVDRGTIYAYEAGRITAPDAGVVWGLANIYKISVDALIQLLVEARTGVVVRTQLRIDDGRTTVELTREEHDLLRRLRQLPARDRAMCREFIEFNRGRSKKSGKSNPTKQD
jgi:transcriptional regulator with XRE-family HTH domain